MRGASHWALAVACAACATPAPGDGHRPITGGVADDGDLAAVALVSGTAVLCSGVLVAPRVVLTAGHCVDAGARPQVFFGGDPAAGGDTRATIDVRLHPDLDPDTFAFDLALLLLEAPAPAAALPWPPAEPLDPSAIGAPLRIIGFGLTAPDDAGPPRKREGMTTIGSIAATDIGFGPDPAQTCVGDSGGPALIDDGGIEKLAGIHSWGDPACAATAHATRVDPFLDSFILPYVAATADGAAATGERCFYEGNCAEGACLAADDEPRLRYCSRPCSGDADCPAEMRCADPEGMCRHPPPSPGALGSACDDVLDCVTGRCARPAADAGGVCSTTCFSDLPDSCPEGFDCAGDVDDPGALACFPGEAGGCACRSAGGAPGPTWLLLLLAGLGAHRRVRRA